MLAGVLAGCAAPIGTERTTVREAYREFAASAIGGELSDSTKRILHRYELARRYRSDPVGALAALHRQATADDRRDTLYALAELSYREGDRLSRSVKPGEPARAADAYLGCAVYAWLYLFSEGHEPPPDAFDRRFRVACDLYNHSVALAFSVGPRTDASVQPVSGVRPLAAGTVTVEFLHGRFRWPLEEIARFLPADQFKVHGLSARDRQSGLGAPLIAVGKVVDEKRFPQSIPATLLLRVPGTIRDWGSEGLRASLELYSSYDVSSFEVNGRRIPLEADTTAPLAHTLNDRTVWQLGNAQFFGFEERIRSNIYLSQPYERGRIPVIFVHGTASSPVWWAEMWNTLRTDRTLRERYQFWNFVYNSGNPVAVSAARLRAEINRKVRQLDPGGTDDALRRMVVIGHSQGGLLAKLTATDTGDALWRAVSEKPFEELELPPEQLDDLRQRVFFEPVPSVKRVVFISTPHRGSYRDTVLLRNVLLRFMRIPQGFAEASARLLHLEEALGLKPGYERRVPTSLDDMSPGNPWLQALAAVPTAEGVAAHSIVAVKGRDRPPEGGDGVVKYVSAHVPYVESEFVVNSGHSCQDKAPVIEEVRRILLVHLGAYGAHGAYGTNGANGANGAP